MAFTDSVTYQLAGGGSDSSRITGVGGGRHSLSENVATGETNKELGFTLDVSACVFFYLVSSQDVVFETNSGGSPTNTLTLKAGVPYFWHTNSYDTFKITADITAVFITNSSGETASIVIEAVYDPTP